MSGGRIGTETFIPKDILHRTGDLKLCAYSAFGKSLCTYKSCWNPIERTTVSEN
jgi:hypothetical protein